MNTSRRLTSGEVMYEVSSHSFSLPGASIGSLSSGGSYGSSYYGDASAASLGAASSNATGTYADMLIQPTAACYAPTYTTDEGCKQFYYHQEGSYSQQPGPECENSPSTNCYHEAGQADGHHPGRIVQTSSSSPEAAAAAAVAEATAALRQSTSTSMFAAKPFQPAGGAFPLRGPTAEGFAVAARLAAGAAAAAADFASTSVAGSSTAYAQPTAVGMTTPATYGTSTSAFQLSSASVDDGSTSIHGFHSAANGFLSTAGASGGPYSAFQKLQTPWTTSRMTMDACPSLDVCKFLKFSTNIHTISFHFREIPL